MADSRLPLYYNPVVRTQRSRLLSLFHRPKIFVILVLGTLVTFTFLFAYRPARISNPTSYSSSDTQRTAQGAASDTTRQKANDGALGRLPDRRINSLKAIPDRPRNEGEGRQQVGETTVETFRGVVDEQAKKTQFSLPGSEEEHTITDEATTKERDKERKTSSSLPDESQKETTATKSGRSDEEKLAKIRDMMSHAWGNYEKYAWGANELDPIAKSANYHTVFGIAPTGSTIVDALDTLYIMGMRKEFEKASEWVKKQLDFDKFDGSVSLFEVNIRYLGGLLSAYVITNDTVFKDKAVDLANRMLPSFNTPSGIPIGSVNLKKDGGKAPWSMSTGVVIAELGTLHLEWMYLSEITGDKKYMDKMKKIRKVITSLKKPGDLMYNAINPGSGNWQSNEVSLGGTADSFYEYLIKSYVMTGEKDQEAADLFFDSIKAMEDNNLLRNTTDGFLYFAQLKGPQVIHRMGHLACFTGGAFALASMHSTGERKRHFRKLAEEITRTCHESYSRTATKIGPEEIMFDQSGTFVQSPFHNYILRPETVESYFYLWRLTHDQKYRDWGWEVVQSLEKYCKVSDGYAGLLNVYHDPPGNDHAQQSFFLSETLKYLYLLFTNDSVYPLDQWVFNTEAHPLPVLSSVH